MRIYIGSGFGFSESGSTTLLLGNMRNVHRRQEIRSIRRENCMYEKRNPDL
jgi:hypothetical protein